MSCSGERIKFDYTNTEYSYHNVEEVTKEQFENCKVTRPSSYDFVVNNKDTVNIKAHIQDINDKKEDGPQTICMGNTETVKYFVCAVKGGRHCDQKEGNQRLEVRVSKNCQTDGKSLISLTPLKQ